HHRGRGLADGAPLALEADVGHPTILAQFQIDRDPVAAEGIVTFRLVAGAFQRTVMTGMPRMIEDHFLVEFAQRVVHHTNIPRALARPAISASTSARVL